MVVCRSEPELVRKHIDIFGAELGLVYDALYNEVLWLLGKWNEYLKLFESQDDVDVLNGTAAFCFAVVQSAMRDDIMLHIARLTDPAVQRVGGCEHKNLSLPSLLPLVNDSARAKDLQALVDAAGESARFAKAYRNKHLAHRDLDHALERAERIPPGSQEEVERVIACFTEVLDHIAVAFGGHASLFESVKVVPGDSRTLITRLSLAKRIMEDRERRITEGRHRPEDFQPPFVPGSA